MTTRDSDSAARLCALLRAAQAENAITLAPGDEDQVLHDALFHGVTPLLHKRLAGHTSAGAFSARLGRAARQSEALELLRLPALQNLLAVLEDAGHDVLLMKGVALAYSLYPSPGQRPRMDTDILIRSGDVRAVRRLLVDRGYLLSGNDIPSTISYQFIATRPLDSGHADAVDVHYRLNNRAEFARLFQFDELWERAMPVGDLGTKAWALGRCDALLLACMHRVGHLVEDEPDRLIWLYDIHLLVEVMDETETTLFRQLLAEKGLTTICRDGIEHAAACFGTGISPALAAALADKPERESSASLLHAGPLTTLWLQFRAQPDWSHRLKMLREIALPPADYMRRKYPGSGAWLPLLYLRRALGGVRLVIGDW